MKRTISFLIWISFLVWGSACTAMSAAPAQPETTPLVVVTEAPLGPLENGPEPVALEPTAAPTEALPEPTATPETQVGAALPVGVVNADNLNLRIGPGLKNPVLRLLAKGLQVDILGRSEQLDWLLVRLPSGTEGWVYSAYVDTQAILADLPLREAYGGAYAEPLAAPLDERKPQNVFVSIENDQAIVTVTGFPGNASLLVTLSPLNGKAGLLVASGVASPNGNATLYFDMPAAWSNGKPISGGNLLLEVSTQDGSASMTAEIQYFRY